MKSRRTLIATIYLFVCWAESSPQDYFPINSQLPPVARISEPFSFIFSPLTFYSPYPTSYSLVNAPEWLRIDSSSRRLFGEPKDEDVPPGEVVGVPIELQAEDESGATTTNATLVVSRNPAPTVKIPLAAQAQGFGLFSPPSSLLFRPSNPFTFTFDRSTFQADGSSELNYYAVSGDNAPLPSWINFNPTNLSFTGTTPSSESLIQPPQTFDIQLVASDVFGFASASLTFSFVVGIHELASTSPLVVLNVTRGTPFEYTDLGNIISLDNRSLRPEEVKSITTSNIPSWLVFDNKTWGLSGTPGLTANSANFTVSIQDTFSNNLNITLAVNVLTGLFRQNFTTLNITAGSAVSLDLKTSLWDPSDVDLELSDNPTDSWLELDLSSLTVSGTAPMVQHALDNTVTVTAISKSTGQKETQAMAIHVSPEDAVPTTTDSPISAPTATPTTIAHPEAPTMNAPLLAVLLPPLLGMLIALIVVLLCLRRRRRKTEEERVLEVSAPIPGSFFRHDTDDAGNGLGHTMFDIGSSSRRSKRKAIHGVAAPNSESPATPFTESWQNSTHGHPVTQQLVTLRSSGSSHTSGTVQRRVLDPFASPPRVLATQDGNSLLSDTSIEEDEYDTANQGPGFSGNAYLDIPMIHEPFSFQNTPVIAYRAGSDYDSSVELVREDAGAALSGNRDSALNLRDMGRRVSRAWKLGTASKLLEEYKRKSYQSTSSARTVRTSFLNTSIAAEKPVSASIISRPTIVHIPSRPGEVRQISRRVDGSSPLFGGGSIAVSPRTLTPITQSVPSSGASTTNDIQRPPPTLQAFTGLSRDSDTSWDMLTRDSLGIAHKDLTPAVKPANVLGIATDQAQDGHKGTSQDVANGSNRSSRDVVSPDHWLRPTMGGSSEETNIPKTAPKLSLYPSVMASHAAPFNVGRSRPTGGARDLTARRSATSDSASDGSPESIARTQHSPRGDQELHVGRIRQQHAAAPRPQPTKSATPSPTEWSRPLAGPPQRPLPDTPTRPPLAERPNEAFRGGRGGGGGGGAQWAGGRSNMTKRSNRTLASERMNDTDDDWEDVRPDESSSAAGSSNGTFPALI